MGKLFGTDGIRGIANQEISCELALKIGRSAAFVLTEKSKNIPKILIGTDTRLSADMLESAIVAGICSVGAHAICIGVIPTPAIPYLIKLYNCDVGIMISASHNPFEYNGIKIFNNEGYKLSDDIEEKIENIVLNDIELPVLIGKNIGKKMVIENAIDDYISFLKNLAKVSYDGLKVAMDCSNGSTYKVAPVTLFELGADVCVINNEPNGMNINKNCGSTHMKMLQEYVKTHNADVGLAFDGDGDRVLAVDELGNIVNGDQILAICGFDLFSKGKLENDTIVGTVMSNMGLELECKNRGINFVRAKVGDRFVLEEMIKNNYSFGGEQSGHVIFRDYNTTGDGIITAIQLLSVIRQSDKKLSELAKIKLFPQVIVNAKVSNIAKNNYLKDSEIYDKIQKLEEEFRNKGRILIRPSGTEPLIRIMIEGEDEELILQKATELASFIEERCK